jgi:ADP-heptose:LPS heptosyltransferase
MGIDVLRLLDSERMYSRSIQLIDRGKSAAPEYLRSHLEHDPSVEIDPPLVRDDLPGHDITLNHDGRNDITPLLIGMNPFCLSPSRQWPVDRWIDLATRCVTQLNAVIALTGVRAHADEAARIVREVKRATGMGQHTDPDEWHIDALPCTDPGIVSLCGKTTVRQLAALLSGLDLFVTSDSGPMHLAFALGTSVVALFGPTSPYCRIPSASFEDFVTADLPCSPCFSGEYEPLCQDYRCMDGITVDAVWERIVAVVSRNRKSAGKK